MASEAAPKFSVPEIAALIVLMAEARELPNPEMEKIAGFALTGPARLKLAKAGLIESRKVGRSYTNVLTEKGWHACRQLSDGERPARAGSAGGALFALLAGLQRGLAARRLSHADFFVGESTGESDGGHVAEALAPADTAGSDPIDERVLRAYRQLANQPGAWVGLADLREALPDANRGDIDAALRRMVRMPGVRLIPVANLKSLSHADHEAAVVIGGEANHALAVTDV
jgi:hypothetical protein